MKYRKKPVVIEAMHFNLENKDRVFNWITCNKAADWGEDDGEGNAEPVIRIETLEGEMIARPGDYIIKGVKGEFYPCKPDIFEATYEPVDDAPDKDVACADILARWVHPQNIEACKKAFEDGDATMEVIHMAAALLALAEDTNDHANDEAADGFDLTAETTRARSDAYRQSYEALLNIWAEESVEEQPEKGASHVE